MKKQNNKEENTNCLEINIRDPFVIHIDGMFYMYGTSADNFGTYTGACVDGERSHVRWNTDGTVIKDVVAVSYSKGAKHE